MHNMALKNITKKYYVANVNLPMGVKKGTYFYVEIATDKRVVPGLPSAVTVKSWIFDPLIETTLKEVPFRPNDEPEFFTEVPKPVQPRFQPGQAVKVITTTTTRSVTTRTQTVSPKMKLVIVKVQPQADIRNIKKGMFKYLVKTEDGSVNVEIREDNLELLKTYWFINSKGIACIETEGRDKTADQFRKSIGNYHGSKDEANAYIVTLRYLKTHGINLLKSI